MLFLDIAFRNSNTPQVFGTQWITTFFADFRPGVFDSRNVPRTGRFARPATHERKLKL